MAMWELKNENNTNFICATTPNAHISNVWSDVN
jgi:hypothetical protein